MSENPGTEQKNGGKKKPPPRRNYQPRGSHGNNEGAAPQEGSSQGGQKRGGGRHHNHNHQHHHNHKIDMKKYEKMISDIQLNFSDIQQSNGAKDDCTICWKPCDVFGIGSCRHPICIECALRIRVLGDQKTCPVCRAETEVLYLMFASNGLQTAPLNFQKHGHPAEDRFAIRFENAAVGERYEQYLAHVCKICKTSEGDRLEFPTFVSLRQHMANVHHLSYCTICTENLNLFSRERKTYSREALSRHIRSGDVDDKSQKGHPTCLFCSQRFFDNEAQYKHLRKEHFYCQFCEADGTMTNHFFNKHEELVAHYKQKHFLCEHEDCKIAGIAFATVLEYNLHKTTHSDKKTVQLDFQYNDRELVGRGRSRRDQNRPHTTVNVVPQAPQPPQPHRPQTEIIVVPSAQTRLPIRYQRGPAFNARVDDFPTLGGGGPSSSGQSQAPAVVVPQQFPRLNKVGKANHPAAAADKNKKACAPVDHFPSLGNRPAPSQANNWGQHTGGFEVIDDDERMGSVSRPPAAVLQPHPAAPRPIPVLRKAQQSQKPAAPIPSEDFPCLPQATGGLSVKSDWANKAKGKSAITGVKMPKKKPLATPDVIPERSVTTPAADFKPVVETWEDVPMKRKMTKKERKALEERMQLAEAMKREEEERDLRERMMVAPAADVELQKILMEDIASNYAGNSASNSAESSNSNVSVGKKNKQEEDFSSVLSKGKNTTAQTNGEQGKKKNGKKQKAPEQTAANFPSLASSQKKAVAAPVEPVPEEPASGLSSWLFSSVSNVFSGLTLSNVLGTDTSQPLSSMSTQVIPQKPKNNNTVTPPPGLQRVPSVPSPAASDEISFDAPPGFESMMMPPGLENSAKDTQQLFSMAPFLSQQDIQRPVASVPSTNADGWSSSKVRNGRAK